MLFLIRWTYDSWWLSKLAGEIWPGCHQRGGWRRLRPKRHGKRWSAAGGKYPDGEKRNGFVMRALDVTYYDVTRCYFIGSLYIYTIYIHIVYIYTYVYYMIYLTLFDITWYYYLMFVHSFDIDISYFYALLLSYYENAIYFFPSWFFVACCSAAYQSIRSMLGWFIEIHQSGLNLLGGLDDSHWKVWPRHLARQQRIRFFFATTVSEVQKAMQFWYLLITSWSGRNHSLQFGIIFDHFFLSIWKTPLSMWNSMISQK